MTLVLVATLGRILRNAFWAPPAKLTQLLCAVSTNVLTRCVRHGPVDSDVE